MKASIVWPGWQQFFHCPRCVIGDGINLDLIQKLTMSFFLNKRSPCTSDLFSAVPRRHVYCNEQEQTWTQVEDMFYHFLTRLIKICFDYYLWSSLKRRNNCWTQNRCRKSAEMQTRLWLKHMGPFICYSLFLCFHFIRHSLVISHRGVVFLPISLVIFAPLSAWHTWNLMSALLLLLLLSNYLNVWKVLHSAHLRHSALTPAPSSSAPRWPPWLKLGVSFAVWPPRPL